jgi:hypothetical protein
MEFGTWTDQTGRIYAKNGDYKHKIMLGEWEQLFVPVGGAGVAE